MWTWPWTSKKAFDAVVKARDELKTACEGLAESRLEYEKLSMRNHNRMVARARERDQAREEVNDLLAEREMQKEEVGQLTAEFHSLSEERDRLEMELAERTRYKLVATVSPSTQGVHQTPCVRFIIREKGDPKILCLSDVDGEPDVTEALATLKKIECGHMVIKQWGKEAADGGQDAECDSDE